MEYRPIRIVDVISDINRDYYLPAIQREFVWEVARIEKLFDSILGDYPIGSMLFWKVKEENKDDWTVYEFVRDFDKENPHNKLADLKGINRDINLVLDGQQRLTSLNIGLKGSYRYFYFKWRTTKLYLNLLKSPIFDEENPEELTFQFKFRDGNNILSDNENELWYQIGRILDFEDTEDAKEDIEKNISHLTQKLQTRAKRLIGRLHSKIHTNKVINYFEEKSQDYDKVLTIFVRANSAGKELEYSDLLLSTATAKWEKLDARKEIYDFSDNINNFGSGYNFGKDFILKGSLYLTEDLPIKYRVKNFNKPNLLKIENNWETIKTYISTTIRLISNYGFNSKNIVAPLSLLVISFFLMKKGTSTFDKSSEINDVQNQIEIRKWFIFAILKNAFGGSSDTKLKNIRDILKKLASYNTFPLKEINKELEIESKFSDDEIKEILTNKYQGRYTYLVLSLLYPDREWKDNVFHEDHIYPQSEFQTRKLRKRGYDDKKIQRYISYYNTILNLQLITDSENLSKSSTPFEGWISTRDEDFKRMHHIPEMECYDLDSFEDFIHKRKYIFIDFLKKI